MSQSILMEWIKPEFNHGPFILSHSDLATRNIMIDDDYNIIAILDWEWSHTVPVQLFVPPSWLANTEWGGVPNPSSEEYFTAAHEFVSHMSKQTITINSDHSRFFRSRRSGQLEKMF
ncbi:hypothetical protein AJ79_04341 [Helicocarpus griseus UAMH5409]|uniref:non-specific serine/threonine protein kinase n=1 Tax=Helicocarpus griseus UAMH5409 TaxID=1447875 RepID=A0A2B7XUF6_9EURO|nr:hypothetical protein AJ79_04341 [Helicocarpus griseus UAMH5409]